MLKKNEKEHKEIARSSGNVFLVIVKKEILILSINTFKE